MRGGVFDPFSSFTGESGGGVPSASVHIGVVKSYIASSKTCMVTVPNISGIEAIGPMQVMQPFSTTFDAPEIGDTVIIAFLDGEFNNAVVLGKIAY